MNFKSKIAIVTGGGGYIGGSICRQLAAKGAKVAVLDRNLESAEKVTAELLGAQALAVDLTDFNAVTAAVNEVERSLGPCDFLITSAGGSARSKIRKFADQEMSVIREVIEINLFGALNSMRALIPGMIARQRGRIVNISSLVAIGGVEGCADYAAAKAGIIAATRTLAMELGPHNININCVCPGKVQRPNEMPPDPLLFAKKHSFLNHLCRAEDIAALTLFLLSEEAACITGQNYIIDGGRSLGLKGDH